MFRPAAEAGKTRCESGVLSWWGRMCAFTLRSAGHAEQTLYSNYVEDVEVNFALARAIINRFGAFRNAIRFPLRAEAKFTW